MPGNPAVKWVKKPSCVEGWRTIRPSTTGIRRRSCFTVGRGIPGGVARTTSSTSTAAIALSAAAEEKAGVQPATLSTATKGTAERICPTWPRMPVSCVSSGTRPGGNQAGTSRIALAKVSASPAPSTMRAIIATPTVSVWDMSTWPSAISTAPAVRVTREP